MAVINPIAEKKPEYPVVEIVVCEKGVRKQELGDGKWERVHFDFLSPNFQLLQ
jgi:hypothetical protein